MNVLTLVVQAVGLFLVTNIDDVIVVSLFFGRAAGQPGTTARIAAGQYLGFGAILVAAVAVAFASSAFLPDDAIPYFGLIPLMLGLREAWEAWRDDDDDKNAANDKPINVLTVAGVTFANGGDNIGVYVPVFVTVGGGGIVAYSIVFLLLVAVLVVVAQFVATRKPVARALKRWDHVLFPLVLIGLGLAILIEGGAFGL